MKIKVLQFLQHDGYIETARAFAKEVHAQKVALNLDPDKEIEGINIKDDEDANKRQRESRPISHLPSLDTSILTRDIQKSVVQS